MSVAILSKGILSVNCSLFQSFTKYNNENNFCKFLSKSPLIPVRMLWAINIEEVKTASSGPEINLPNQSCSNWNLPGLLVHWQFSLKERFYFKAFITNMKKSNTSESLTVFMSLKSLFLFLYAGWLNVFS